MAKRKPHPLMKFIEIPKNLEDLKSYCVVRVAADDPRTDADIRSVMLRAAARGDMKGLTPDDVIDAKVIRGNKEK